ncbi:ABC transporter permease [Candidatus Saccharibacteria bacterium]|nr:ABC transporter permease [Candidatus Saccharibacteria bacterium]
MWSGNVKAAVNSLRTSKWRSLLTMLGIIIGVSSVVTIVSLGQGLKNQILGQINQLGSDVVTVRSGKIVNEDNGGGSSLNFLGLFSASTLSDADVTALKELPSAKAVVPMAFVTNSAKSGNSQLDNVFVIGTSPEMSQVLNQKVKYGEFFTQDSEDTNFAVIGPNIAHKIYGELNPVGQSIEVLGESFVIRGILSQSSGGLFSIAQTDFNSAVFIPFSHAKRLTDNRLNILQIVVRGQNPDNLDPTIEEVKKTLLSTHKGQENFSVLKQYELLSIASGVVNTITGFISGIAAISLLVGGIGIMNIMLVSVSERTREIGIRKALGATNRQILSQFLVEGMALSIGGGLIGIIASAVIYFGLRIYTDLQPVITLPVVALAVLVSVSLGIIFSVAPALKAARKDPIQALRGD